MLKEKRQFFLIFGKGGKLFFRPQLGYVFERGNSLLMMMVYNISWKFHRMYKNWFFLPQTHAKWQRKNSPFPMKNVCFHAYYITRALVWVKIIHIKLFSFSEFFIIVIQVRKISLHTHTNACTTFFPIFCSINFPFLIYVIVLVKCVMPHAVKINSCWRKSNLEHFLLLLRFQRNMYRGKRERNECETERMKYRSNLNIISIAQYVANKSK